MECTWDVALLQHADELPVELLQMLQEGSDEHYLDSITRATAHPRYTSIILTHCGSIMAHVCASMRNHTTFAHTVATLGRIIPFAPYLLPYAEEVLSGERYKFDVSAECEEDVMYLLGLYRLYCFARRPMQKFIKLQEITSLLEASKRSIRYLAIRIMQLYLNGADCWFEQMVRRYLGEDHPDEPIDGPWDDRLIDYRFLTLWEEDKASKVAASIARACTSTDRERIDGEQCRVIPTELFHRSCAMVGPLLLPRITGSPRQDQPRVEDLVQTPTVIMNIACIAPHLRSSAPLLLLGPAGCGKTSLIRYIGHRLGKLDRMITLHLNAQSDAKLLTGVYTTGDTPGTFVWKPGLLTTAVLEGRWILIEDLDHTPDEIMGTLLPLIERGELFIPSRRETLHAAPGFRIFATARNVLSHGGSLVNPTANKLGMRHWRVAQIASPSNGELLEMCQKLKPALSPLLPQLLAVFERLHRLMERPSREHNFRTGVIRPITSRDLFKLCHRAGKLVDPGTPYTTSNQDELFLESVDCFVGAMPDSAFRNAAIAMIAEELLIDPQRREFLIHERHVRYGLEKSKLITGRFDLSRARQGNQSSWPRSLFAPSPQVLQTLEKVAGAIVNREPLLLVGETGIGKTATVQHLAQCLGKVLVPFNMSQQSEAGDLLGGLKPVSTRSLLVPLQNEFAELFASAFSLGNNQRFMDMLNKQMSKSNWKGVCRLWHQALDMMDQGHLPRPRESANGEKPSKKRKIDAVPAHEQSIWRDFARKVHEVEARLGSGTQQIAFTFVEGNVVTAIRKGDWVLLDEINLASPETLESIVDLLDPTSPSLLLTEAGEIERIEAHPDFRLFAAMNPATDIGKRDLPLSIRSRFSEIYVESPDRDIRSLQSIVQTYLRQDSASDTKVALETSILYQRINDLSAQNKLVDGAGQKPHFSLRTLTRTLMYAKRIAPQCSLRRALYEGFQMSFLTMLDVESAKLVQPLLEQHLLGKKTNLRAELRKGLRRPDDPNRYVEAFPGSQHWIQKGNIGIEEQPHYILTPYIRKNLENLVRASSTRQFPVLIQGPTSSGKTSMIEYLARRTGHRFVRINNHEHTDLQEYLGTYASDANGRLHFHEGLLVKALRDGHWLVLDELNLAPTDVLEALNRLLDDNRELLIPETQEIVRPHDGFMLFATQNPAGLYGGRKTLSRAFRNRFLELHFDEIPVEELQEILHRRTQLPESRCRRIVSVYKELSVLRQEARIFEQRSFATLRDLFRWAMRPNDTIEQLAHNGFMLLAERVRKEEERDTLRSIIERVMSANGPRVEIREDLLYSLSNPEISHYQHVAGDRGIVWTKAMRRLYTLVALAVANNEPVLLVGETGCGKTAVCQMLADAYQSHLHTVNAHQNTEAGDLIGTQRPIRNRAATEVDLRRLLLESPILKHAAMNTNISTDALLDHYDAVVARSSDAVASTENFSILHHEIKALRTRLKGLFEWVDGSLVTAMKTGSFFLLDEISLAEDSVIERINSVLESQRSILLAEQGSLDSYVVASQDFQFLATMNPGGDYGKRELSPALRNRFTEIWVPNLSDEEDVVQIVNAKLRATTDTIATAMVKFGLWFKNRFHTPTSTSVSIRDLLAWVQFFNHVTTSANSHDSKIAAVHGAALVYIDTLGANPAGMIASAATNIDRERETCLAELGRLLFVDVEALYSAPAEVSITEKLFAAGPFSYARTGNMAAASNFSFLPPTTKTNTVRVLRALQLTKPILLEGSPGVGKTALITAIADTVGIPLTRINLSEQTDIMDLFGSDVPINGAQAGVFAWQDAPFLRAMKRGEWVLLDEMNLASQSVLEGLNACLDHRGEVYIPELGKAFTRHTHFRLFAAQNPHHQGGGRKGLPASFVNRFTVCFVEAFAADDLRLICQQRFPKVSDSKIAQAVDFVQQLSYATAGQERLGSIGRPWEFNLRDLCRWCSLASENEIPLASGTSKDFAEILVSQRFRSPRDRAFVDSLFGDAFAGETYTRTELFSNMFPQTLQLGLGVLRRDENEAKWMTPIAQPRWTASGLRTLESVMVCVRYRWPVLLTGPSGCGKSFIVERLAACVGQTVVTIALNSETDALDLIGTYEQEDFRREVMRLSDAICLQLKQRGKSHLVKQDISSIADILRGLDTIRADEHDERIFQALSNLDMPEAKQLARLLEFSSPAPKRASFTWIDGVLISAMQEGKWLVLDNANLCSSSVLDRLNSLLEPDGTLALDEQSESDGSPRILVPHPEFRVFLTADPKYGELSQAMRNRAVELYVSLENDKSCNAVVLDPLHPESAVAQLRQSQILREGSHNGDDALSSVIADHLRDRDLPLYDRFLQQLQKGLYDKCPGSLKNSFALTQHVLRHRALENLQNQPEPHYKAIGREQTSSKLAPFQVSDGRATPNVGVMIADGGSFSIQTFHPLNNAPLISSSAPSLLGADFSGFIYDAFSFLSDSLRALQDFMIDTGAMTRLVRLERSIGVKPMHGVRGGQSSICVLLEEIAVLIDSTLRGSTSSASLSSVQLSATKIHFGRVVAFWKLFGDAATTGQLDAARLRALVSAGRRIATLPATESGDHFSSLFKGIDHKLQTFLVQSSTSQGRALLILWRRFRPYTAPNVTTLRQLLRLETIVKRCDSAFRHFTQSLDEMVDLRLAFTKALDLALHGDPDLSSVCDRLESASIGLEQDESNAATLGPHFIGAFQRLYGMLILRDLADRAMTTSDMIRLELLTLRATTAGVSRTMAPDTDGPFNGFHRLAAFTSFLVDAIGQDRDCHDPPASFVHELSTATEDSLTRLPLLENEVSVLGKIVASNAHSIVAPRIDPLDALLKDALTQVVAALQSAADPDLQAVGSAVMQSLETTIGTIHMQEGVRGIDDGLQSCTDGLLFVAAYFRSVHDTENARQTQCAKAWSAFGSACLYLYIPVAPFDPALESKLDVDVYRQHRKALAVRLDAIRTFRQRTYGEPQSLRSRIIEHDLLDLGSEPPYEPICRPDVSEMSRLQVELDALMRTVRTSWSAVLSPPFPPTLLLTLVGIRDRLQQHYRSYDDFTSPIIGFLDCLLVGQKLASETQWNSDQKDNLQLAQVVPLANASLEAWSNDHTFIDAARNATSHSELSCLLTAAALRSASRPLPGGSQHLRDTLHQVFARLHHHWKAELDVDQQKAVSHSSVYKYRSREVDAEEPSPEELEDIFPTTTCHASRLVESSRAQDFAHEVASLHVVVFSPGECDGISIENVLRKWWQTNSDSPFEVAAKRSMPALITELHYVNLSFAGRSDPETYNIYTDSNVTEAKKLYDILKHTTQRFKELHEAWPEHATPLEVLQVCSRTAAMSYATPLFQFLPLVEKIYVTVREWNRIASKQYSVQDVFDRLTSLIISWRQQELSAWAGIFNREWNRSQTDAASWWHVSYEAIMSAVGVVQSAPEHAERYTTKLLQTLSEFVLTSGLGEYGARLRILHGFQSQLHILAIDVHECGLVHRALSNFLAYFSLFEKKVDNELSTGRSELEKQVKDLIQLASWKDRNIDVLRQNAQASHRKLFRLVQKYRRLLARPVGPIIQAGLSGMVSIELEQSVHSAGQLPYKSTNFEQRPIHQRSRLLDLMASRHRDSAATSEIVLSKAQQIRTALDAAQQMQAFSHQLANAIIDLRSATPAVLTEENKQLVAHLKTRKRRLLADVLKNLRSMGFQVTASHKTQGQQSLEAVLTALPVADQGTSTADLAILRSMELDFFRFLGVIPVVRERVRQHSDDLTHAEVNRCVAIAESMLYETISMRRNIIRHSNHMGKLHTTLHRMATFSSCSGTNTIAKTSYRMTLRSASLPLTSVIGFIVTTLTLQMSLSANDYSDVISALQTCRDELSNLHLVDDEVLTCFGLETGRYREKRLRQAAGLKEVLEVVSSAIKSRPELGPVLQHISRWVPGDLVFENVDSSSAKGSITLVAWANRLLKVFDMTLGAIERAGNIVEKLQNTNTGTDWLLSQHRCMADVLESFYVEHITNEICNLMDQLQFIDGIGSDHLSHAAAICHNLLPVFEAYEQTLRIILTAYAQLQTQLCRNANQLSTTFIELADRGFCTPSDQVGKHDGGESSIEGGTGLGEGEGAEDVSRDVGPDEDLSELAQESTKNRQENEMEDVKDAVDMADEELQGEVDEAGGSQQDDNDASDGADDDAEASEEVGEVDDNDASAIDEKIWDAPQNEHEKPAEGSAESKGDRETQDPPNDRAGDERTESGGHDVDDAVPEIDEEREMVQDGNMDALDRHAEQEENLDLPEDLGSKEEYASESETSDAPSSGVLEDADDIPESASRDIEDNLREETMDEANDAEDNVNAEDDVDAEPDPMEGQRQDDIDPASGKDPELMTYDAPTSKGDEEPDHDTGTGQGTDTHMAPSEDQAKAAGIQGQTADEYEHDEAESSAPQGTGTGAESGDDSAKAKSLHDQDASPFRQIGDVLKQWYDNQRPIHDADAEPDGEDGPRPEEGLLDAEFKHLRDDEVDGDVQALGTASVEQSKALNEENATSLEVNDRLSPPRPDDEARNDSSGVHENVTTDLGMDMQIDDVGNVPPTMKQFHNDEDEDPSAPEEEQGLDFEDMETVDHHLHQTHISSTEEETPSPEKARAEWAECEQSTHSLAMILTEQLRLILQPTQATKMRGDFRTGKRLNIRRIIPYIASSYKRDKIWMRRSIPSKRSYQVMLAIDDSKSMLESGGRELAFRTLAMVAKSMSLLEVGELSIIGFGDDVKIMHEFDTPFTADVGAEICRRFAFAQSKTNVRRLLGESTELFRAARLRSLGTTGDLWQLQLIISDGICEDHPSIRQLVRQAHDEKIMIVFIIIDPVGKPRANTNPSRQSVLDLQTAEFIKDASGQMQLRMVKYLDTFPFRFYLIVQDVQELPNALAGALRQWFAEVVDTRG